jgi:sortase (surface protein transpeptidase)
MGKGAIISIGLLALSLTGLALFRTPLEPVLEELAPTAFAETAGESVGSPLRLRIPAIGVDAAIESVALTPEGAMDVPKQPMDAGWYALGPRPGEVGSAVIAGHVDWWGGKPGVFKQLRTVVPGDRLSVLDEAGKETVFIVREIRTYDAAADATEIFFSTDGKVRLNLITCEGEWNAQAKQYGERLVVFASEE